MTNGQELTHWEQRWQALDKTIEDFYCRLVILSLFDRIKFFIFHTVKQPEAKQPEQILSHLAKRLRDFAKNQFYFFHDGLDGGFTVEKKTSDGSTVKKTYKLQKQKKKELPREHILWATTQQIHYDAEVFSRAMAQRRGSEAMKSALEKGDRLVLRALEPVKEMLDEQPDAVTYFQKYPSIRVIPYAPVALISVPLTVSTVPRDYLVTPHEVGHYVYWRGKHKGKPIYRALANLLNDKNLLGRPGYEQIRRWREEIFADVCGCLIGGPVVALSSQEVALEYYSALDFTADDGEHPVPALRPCIYIRVLEEMGWVNAARILKERWAAALNKRMSENPQLFTENPEDPNPPFTRDDVCERISTWLKIDLEIDLGKGKDVIQVVFDLLPGPKEDVWLPGWTKKDFTDDQVPEQLADFDQLLYRRFAEFAAELEDSQDEAVSGFESGTTEESWETRPFDWEENWLGPFLLSDDTSGTGEKPVEIIEVKADTWAQTLEPWTTEIGNHDSGG